MKRRRSSSSPKPRAALADCRPTPLAHGGTHRLRSDARNSQLQRIAGATTSRPTRARKASTFAPSSSTSARRPRSIQAIAAIIIEARQHRRRGAQCGRTSLRPGRSLHAGATRRALRRHRALHPARQSRRPAAHAPAQPGTSDLDITSSSAPAARRPICRPSFAAKAALDAIAVQYARELSRWGIETSIVVPGAFTERCRSLRWPRGVQPTWRERRSTPTGPTAGLAEGKPHGLSAG